MHTTPTSSLIVFWSVPQCPLVHVLLRLGHCTLRRQGQDPRDTTLLILPLVSIHPMVKKQPQEASRRRDDRSSRAGKARKTEEVQLVVARRRGKQPGGCGCGGVSRMLARQDELADWHAGILLPGLLELRRQTAVQRTNFQRVWSVPL